MRQNVARILGVFSPRFKLSATPAGLLLFVVALNLGISPSVSRGQSLDSALRAGTNAEVFAVAVQPDRKTLIGGIFTTVGGASHSYLARFNANGTLDDSFQPRPNSAVYALRVQSDGKILVGGDFQSIGTSPVRTRAFLARLNPDGSVDATFTQGANGRVRDFVLQTDGKVVVTGRFTQLAGAPRSSVGRLNSDGSLDTTFAPTLAGTLNGNVLTTETVALTPDGKILIGGNFTTVNGQSSPGMSRLFPNGLRDGSFSPTFSAEVYAIAFQPDGRFYVGGNFTRISGQQRPYIARFNADGSLDPVIPPPTNGIVRSIALQPDGRIVIGGLFTEVGPVRRSRIARYNSDTSLDNTFIVDLSGSLGTSPVGVYAVAATGTGQVVVGGAFSSINGVERNGIARFSSPLPKILTAPTSLFVTPGASAGLSVVASGENLFYQWKLDGVDIRGATTSSLTLTSVQAAHAGVYTVSVSNDLGTELSTPARLTLGTPPNPAYTVSTIAGTPNLGGPPYLSLNRPLGIAVNTDGTVFVMDGGNNYIRELNHSAGSEFLGILTGIAGWGLAVDPVGNLYVADADRRIARVTRAGVVSNFAGAATPGAADGPAATAQFRAPRGVAVDTDYNVYVADSDNFTIRKISPQGIVSTLAGLAGSRGTTDGTGAAARFNAPWSIAVDRDGTLFVADRNTLRRVSPAGVVTTAVPIGTIGDVVGVATDNAGNAYVTDAGRDMIRKISADGRVTVLAGTGSVRGHLDGVGSAAHLNSPWNIAIDTAGNLFFTDNGSHTVRKAVPDALPLAILAAPQPQHAAVGSGATLTVSATGADPTFQWKKDGVPIAGATQSFYRLTQPVAADNGFYSVVVTSQGSSVESSEAILTADTAGNSGRLINVATRGFIEAGGALTPGFVLRGSGSKQVLLRGVGPSLLRFGLGGALPNPRFELIPVGGVPLLANDDWPSNSAPLLEASSSVGAFPLDAGSKDAAVLSTLNTSVSSAYTVRITAGSATETGIALAEIYDADPLNSPMQIANVSTRGFVGLGANALVPGFVIGGSGPLQVLIRAVGPGLSPFGVTGVLADPKIIVTPLGKELPVAANDNWGGTSELSAAFAACGAFPLPANSLDAVVLVRLPPGAYTVTVSGTTPTTGVALVEIYDVP